MGRSFSTSATVALEPSFDDEDRDRNALFHLRLKEYDSLIRATPFERLYRMYLRVSRIAQEWHEMENYIELNCVLPRNTGWSGNIRFNLKNFCNS